MRVLWQRVGHDEEGEAMRHDQAVFADIQTIWEARDKRRTHYVWAMPRDMWLLLRGCRDNNVGVTFAVLAGAADPASMCGT